MLTLHRYLVTPPCAQGGDSTRSCATGITPLGAGGGLHSLKCTGVLVDTPVALPGNKTGRHIDCAARKHFKFGGVFAASASVPLQAALKSSPSKFCGVDRQFFIGKPIACSNFIC